MRFAIDLDGVLSNFTARVISVANTLWPGRLRSDFVPDNWDYVGTFTKEEWDKIWAQIKNTPNFWLDAPPLSGVEDLWHYLERPNNGSDEVFFVTSRAVTVGYSPQVQSSQWLNTLGLWPRKGRSVVLCVADAKHKQDLFRGLGLKFMLDDFAPTVYQLNEIDGMHAFVLDQPYNQHAKDLPRVYSVTEYLDTIKDIEAGL
jgi:hypothetical protein